MAVNCVSCRAGHLNEFTYINFPEIVYVVLAMLNTKHYFIRLEIFNMDTFGLSGLSWETIVSSLMQFVCQKIELYCGLVPLFA